MRTTYIGMDIHKNFIQAAAMDKDGTILNEVVLWILSHQTLNQSQV